MLDIRIFPMKKSDQVTLAEARDIEAGLVPTPGPRYVLSVRDGENHEVLVSTTSQGYANPGDAEALAIRLFGTPEGTALPAELEAAWVTITYADGSVLKNRIR